MVSLVIESLAIADKRKSYARGCSTTNPRLKDNY